MTFSSDVIYAVRMSSWRKRIDVIINDVTLRDYNFIKLKTLVSAVKTNSGNTHKKRLHSQLT